jgi:hypothetical protein
VGRVSLVAIGQALRACSRRIELAGVEVETPLLVPGFSSKAVGPIHLGRSGRRDDIVASSAVHTDTFVRGIDEAILISAYDIHHGLIAESGAFSSGFTSSPYAEPRLLIIDSGWYEKSVGPASGQWYHEVGDAALFERSDYDQLLDGLDANVNALVVSWDDDSESSYIEQIAAGQRFFADRPRFGSIMLLKPEGRKLHHDVAGLSKADAARMRAFDVIGVTEKDLGNKILTRLSTLADLRERLDQASVQAPIHVFGGLDPLYTPLYFVAGAEIFDGLSWLRYSFRDGVSIYRDAAPLLDGNLEMPLPVAVGRAQLENLDALVELTRELKVFFHSGGDFAKLRRREIFEPAVDALESEMRSHGR